MMPLSPPTAPKTVIMIPAMIHAQEAQKCQFVILGFLTSSQKIEGREYVVGPNPRAPMKPSRSAAKSKNRCKACTNSCSSTHEACSYRSCVRVDKPAGKLKLQHLCCQSQAGLCDGA